MIGREIQRNPWMLHHIEKSVFQNDQGDLDKKKVLEKYAEFVLSEAQGFVVP